MPAIVGNIKIISVGSAGIVQIGDALQLNPQSTTKTFAGSGSFNTGDIPMNFNAVNATNTNDSDLLEADQARAGNVGRVS